MMWEKYKVRVFFGCIIFCLLMAALSDLGNQKSYLKPIFVLLYSFVINAYRESVEIAQTPLASLTIAKISVFVFYNLIAWFILMCAWGIWSSVNEMIEDQQNKRYEEELEEARCLDIAQEEYLAYIAAMEAAETLSKLDSMFYYATGKWPRWEKELSRVYRERLRWLETHNP